MKIKYIIAILISVGIFNSCSGLFVNKKPNIQDRPDSAQLSVRNTAYGSYLAARVAHLRHDYNSAANYYMEAKKLGADDADLLSKIYLLLTSEGRIDEAAIYANQAIEQDETNNFVRFISIAYEAKHKNFDKALEHLSKIKDKSYKESISPLFKAWLLAGKNNQEQALKELDAFKDDPTLVSFYYMHRGLINDYFNNKEAAQKDFDTIVDDNNLEISFRALQLISNFYVRNNQIEKAQTMIQKFNNKNFNSQVFTQLLNSVNEVNKNRTVPLIDSPEKGLGEAIFNVGVVYRNYQNDIAQIFTSLALYLNPDNDVARISHADLLEKNNRQNDAIEQYKLLNKHSPLYYMAHLKTASVLIEQNNYDYSLKILTKLLEQHPDDYDILFNLGEVYRMQGNNKKAIKYYNLALEKLPNTMKGNWMVYYALGMSYEKNNQWDEAEQVLKKALKISNRHPYVLNYLGYVWLENNQNYNEALYMIFEAYKQQPENGHIMDSMGWALYRMGKYTEAVEVLERAAEYLPANAVVCDHLGDLYWQLGRKDEARYQWQHALTLKEDSDMIDTKLLKEKILNGAQKPTAIIYNESLLIKRLKSLKIEQ